MRPGDATQMSFNSIKKFPQLHFNQMPLQPVCFNQIPSSLPVKAGNLSNNLMCGPE